MAPTDGLGPAAGCKGRCVGATLGRACPGGIGRAGDRLTNMEVLMNVKLLAGLALAVASFQAFAATDAVTLAPACPQP